MDSKFIVIMAKRSIISISWFSEMGDSKIYQKWRTVVLRLLFGCFVMKQMHLKLIKDGWRKDFGSATLGAAQNRICHWWSLSSSWGFLAYSWDLRLVKGSKMMVYDETIKLSSRSFEFSAKFPKWRKWWIERKWKFFCLECGC